MSALWHQYWKAENNLPPCCLGFVSTADAKIIIFPWVHAADVHAALSAVTRVLGNLKPVLDFTSSLSIIQYGSAVQLQHKRATGDYAKIQMRRCIASPLNPAGQHLLRSCSKLSCFCYFASSCFQQVCQKELPCVGSDICTILSYVFVYYGSSH